MKYTEMMKRVSMAALAVSLAACGSSSGASSTASSETAAALQSASTEKKSYKVAVVKQLDHASLDEIAAAITAELDKLASENGVTIDYGEVYSGQNDQTTLQQIGTQVIADQVDVIIPIATTAAQTMTVAAEDSKTPVIFAAISDPEAAGLTDIDYVTGTSDALNTKQIMDMIFAQNPDASKIGLLYSQSEINSETPIADAKAYLKEKGFSDSDIVEATGNTDSEVQAAASSLVAAGVDAVFTPTDNVVMATEPRVAEILQDAGIPHYTGADSFVQKGALVTCGVNYTDLGTETADLAYKAMTEGIDATGYAGTFETMPGGIITVNTETADALGIDDSVFSSFGELVEVTTSED